MTLFSHLSRRHFLIASSLSTLIPSLALSQEVTDRIDRKIIQAELDSITIYLNSIRTLSASITQRSSRGGGQLTGKLTLKRPGQLHLDYDDPSPLTLIADSQSLIIIDKNLKEVQSIPLSQTPANFFLQRTIDLSPRKIAILDYSLSKNTMSFDITSSEVDNQNRLRISFTKKPVSLLGWTLIEADNNTTEIFLKNITLNKSVDTSLFSFKNPWK